MSNMVVQTNILALNSHRNMKGIGSVQARSSQRLSSGYKINTAADDAAGLAISEKMRAQIRGLDMASKNSQDGQALVQTAEGGMQEIDNMIQRVRELVVQAANDTNEGPGADRQKIQDEITNLVEEIDSMAGRVEFNKKKVINGDYANRATMSNLASTNVNNASTAYANASVAYSAASVAYSTQLAANSNTGTTGANTETLKNQYDALSAAANATSLAHSGAAVTNASWSTRATESLWFQVGANAKQGINVNIGAVTSDILGIGSGDGKTSINVVQSRGSAITNILNVMDTALSYVTTERSKLGAVQNRLEYTMRSLDISSENLSDAESRVRNADMAKEMMDFTKANVLQQAAVSMLSQANQQPQSILQLLR